MNLPDRPTFESWSKAFASSYHLAQAALHPQFCRESPIKIAEQPTLKSTQFETLRAQYPYETELILSYFRYLEADQAGSLSEAARADLVKLYDEVVEMRSRDHNHLFELIWKSILVSTENGEI